MSLRIAFDLDGTLADLDSALAEIAERLYPGRLRKNAAAAQRAASPEVPANDPPGASVERSPDDPPGAEREVESAMSNVLLSSRQQEAVWRAVRETENFWDTLEEIEPGTVRELGTLALERRWEVIFLTQRPTTAGESTQLQSQKWLSRHGFPMPSVFVVPAGTRGRVAHALDLHLVVDDRAENCLEVNVESKARAILVWRRPQETMPGNAKRLGIGVVSSIAECLHILQEIDDLHQPAPSMLDRLRKRLGI